MVETKGPRRSADGRPPELYAMSEEKTEQVVRGNSRLAERQLQHRSYSSQEMRARTASSRRLEFSWTRWSVPASAPIPFEARSGAVR